MSEGKEKESIASPHLHECIQGGALPRAAGPRGGTAGRCGPHPGRRWLPPGDVAWMESPGWRPSGGLRGKVRFTLRGGGCARPTDPTAVTKWWTALIHECRSESLVLGGEGPITATHRGAGGADPVRPANGGRAAARGRAAEPAAAAAGEAAAAAGSRSSSSSSRSSSSSSSSSRSRSRSSSRPSAKEAGSGVGPAIALKVERWGRLFRGAVWGGSGGGRPRAGDGAQGHAHQRQCACVLNESGVGCSHR